MNVDVEIEAAEREYLCARVANLARMDGNPYGASVYLNGDVPCFQVKAASTPMLNRIHGDPLAAPEAIVALLGRSRECATVTPATGPLASLPAELCLAGHRLKRVRGWTHLQFACAVGQANHHRHQVEIEEVTSQTLPAFAELHGSGFRASPAQRVLNLASFQDSAAMKVYVIREAGQVVAGALMYLASNGVAYLGTACTRREARGRGYHAALIAHRIERAREHGSLFVAATALANSQSRRNLQRAGLSVSHAQALYRLAQD